MSDNAVVTSLKRGLEILAALNQPEVSDIRHLHTATGLPKATIVRLLTTMVALGYVNRRATGGYQLTAKVLGLSRGYNSADYLLQVARPVLEWLRREHVWPSDLAACDQDAMVILDTGTGVGTLSLNRTVGSRLPIMPTAFGRVHLAFCGAEEREKIIARLVESPHPQDFPARDRKAVDRMLAEVRSKGYAVSDGEYRRGTRGVAVPVLVDGSVIACINMMAVAQAMSMRQAERAFLPPLRHAASSIARAYASGRST